MELIDRRTALIHGVMASVGGLLSTDVVFGSRQSPVREHRVMELRQYTLRRGRRDELIELFEREFVESQAAVGAPILGTFRDLDDPDRFVWIRGFESMATRAAALTTFYTGPVWRAHGRAAGATMIDSGNALLLRPIDPIRGHGPTDVEKPGVITANIHYLRSTNPETFVEFFSATLRPRLKEAGIEVTSTYVTESAVNDYAALPVREGDPVFVWFARFADVAAERAAADRVAGWSGWRDDAPRTLLPALMRKPERLRLAPTARSTMR